MADSERLMMESALRQLDGKMNYKILAQDLGIGDDASAAKRANMRWLRFRAKLLKIHTGSPAASHGTKRASPEHSTTSKGKPTKNGSPTKKSKIKAMDSDDEEEMQIKEEKGAVVLETPTRRGPERQGRVTTFKDEGNEEEDFDLKFNFPDSEDAMGSSDEA